MLWIVDAGSGPEEGLGLRPFGREGLPSRAAEKLLILLVGEPGVGDGNLAADSFEQSFLAGIRSGLELFVDLAINQGIDAADEKAGHARHVAGVPTLLRARFETW